MSKEKILNILRESEDFISGQMLADELGVSRNTIWKYMKALAEDGYKITSITNRGYRLEEITQQLNEAEILRQSSLNPEQLRVFKSLSSTNDWLKEHQEELVPGTVVITGHQTHGRGRQGRSFHSPAHEGIYFSLLFKDELIPRFEFVTIAAALAVAKVLEDMGFSPAIKWVNDIYINQRKVCGILTEGELELETRQMKYLILGIGINVNNESFPDDLKEVASSLKLVAGHSLDLNELAAKLITQVSQAMNSLMPQNNEEAYQEALDGLIKAFNHRLSLKGEFVTLIAGSGLRVTGKLIGINDKGHIVIDTKDGTKSFPYGEYRLSVNEQIETLK